MMILDFNMPDMDGLTLGEKLKEKFSNGKISLLTTSIQDSTQQKISKLDISFVGKSITYKKTAASSNHQRININLLDELQYRYL